MIFGIAMVTFMIALLIGWILFRQLSSWMEQRASEEELAAQARLYEYYWWTLAKVWLIIFSTLLLFVFSVSFATELLYSSLSSALNYLLVAIRLTLLASLAFYFALRNVAIRWS